jgi:hypothetical protein
MSRYSGLDDDGQWYDDGAPDFAARLEQDLESKCPGGCGMSSLRCLCRLETWAPKPFQTLTQIVREAEADVNEEDLKGSGLTMDDWQRIRQWPEDG